MWIALALTFNPAHADMDVCFQDNTLSPLVDFHVVHSEYGWVNEYVTDANGCVEIITWSGWTPVTLKAENRVVQVVEGAIPSQNVLTSVHGQLHTLTSDDYVLAASIQHDYDVALSGFGPFTAEPTGSYGEQKITADLDSIAAVGLAFTEPFPAGPVADFPRLHLNPGDELDGTATHELMHALHMSHLSETTRLSIEAQYIGFLVDQTYHYWDQPSTEMVAYLEGVAALGDAAHFQAGDGFASELELLSYVRTASSGLELTGDDTIEGVVAGILYGQFAYEVGLDYLLDTMMDCDTITLQDYAQCIEDLEGDTSVEFSALRRAADVFNVSLDAMPLGDWDYCNANYSCGHGEGDCDSDGDCASGTSCEHDVGASYGMTRSVDVCVTDLRISYVPRW